MHLDTQLQDRCGMWKKKRLQSWQEGSLELMIIMTWYEVICFPPHRIQYRTGDTFIYAVIIKCLKVLIHQVFNIKHMTPASDEHMCLCTLVSSHVWFIW
jgi:hypothetical protein